MPAAHIENSSVAMESPRTQSPPSSCGSNSGVDTLERTEDLGTADALLADDNWSWLVELLDPVRDAAVRRQSKVFFARLYKTQEVGEIEPTLAEMETWRADLSRDSELKLARALFLLGHDKHMSLAR